MEKPDIFDSQELDPYDREERCRKIIREVARAVVMRLLVGVLLLAAVVRAGANPAVLGLGAFVLVIAVSGAVPLARELGKQRKLLKECLAGQEELEKKKE